MLDNLNLTKIKIGNYDLNEADYLWLCNLYKYFDEFGINFEDFIDYIISQPSSWIEEENEQRLVDGYLVSIDFEFIDSLPLPKTKDKPEVITCEHLKKKY